MSVLWIPVLAYMYNSFSILQSHDYCLWPSLWLPTSKWEASRESWYRRWQVTLVSLLHPGAANPTLPCLHYINFLCTLQPLHQVLLYWYPYVPSPTQQQPHISLPACLQAAWELQLAAGFPTDFACRSSLSDPQSLLMTMGTAGIAITKQSCFMTTPLSNRNYNPNYLC